MEAKRQGGGAPHKVSEVRRVNLVNRYNNSTREVVDVGLVPWRSMFYEDYRCIREETELSIADQPGMPPIRGIIHRATDNHALGAGLGLSPTPTSLYVER